ncbi:CsbD family protein [Thiomonas intermedia]|uniref:CsbD family protein n=1 Tax=Thiomonas intermedia TaxID=926 RepID=UPI0009A49D3F|nr:CsbD family protein [Thiomonas intermedia]
MNWDQIEGNWKQLKGHVRTQWGKLTDDDLEVVAGKRDKLAGVLQERYGLAKEAAEKQVKDWEDRLKDADRP